MKARLHEVAWVFIYFAAYAIALYGYCMFRAILSTPETGWEWALAWQYMNDVL